MDIMILSGIVTRVSCIFELANNIGITLNKLMKEMNTILGSVINTEGKGQRMQVVLHGATISVRSSHHSLCILAAARTMCEYC